MIEEPKAPDGRPKDEVNQRHTVHHTRCVIAEEIPGIHLQMISWRDALSGC